MLITIVVNLVVGAFFGLLSFWAWGLDAPVGKQLLFLGSFVVVPNTISFGEAIATLPRCRPLVCALVPVTAVVAFAAKWALDGGSCPWFLLFWWAVLGAVGFAIPYLVCRFVHKRLPGSRPGGTADGTRT